MLRLNKVFGDQPTYTELLVNKDFAPTSHIFYTVRAMDVADQLPKWESYPGVGQPLKCDANGVPVKSDASDAKDDADHSAKKAKTTGH